MYPSMKRLFCTTAVFVLLASPASGGLLLDDPSKSVTSGSEAFTFFTLLKAHVEYAVFAPGAFENYTPLGTPAFLGPFDPSGGDDYVYAYQIFDDGGSKRINALSISLQPGVVGIDPILPDELPIAGGLEPDAAASGYSPAGNPKDSIHWNYLGTSFTSGGYSEILLFTSAFEPEDAAASMSASFAGATGMLPSPSLTAMPEPSTLVLSAMAAIGFLAAGYRRRRKV